jgi:hypothetical protein
MVTCPNCKQPVRGGAKFCASCGAALHNIETPRPEQPSAVPASAAPAPAAPASAVPTAAAATTRPLVNTPPASAPVRIPASQAVRTQPVGAQTRQLVPAGTNTSGPRPLNAVLGDRYRVTELLHNNAGRMFYSVTTFPATRSGSFAVPQLRLDPLEGSLCR